MQIMWASKVSKGTSGSGHIKGETGEWDLDCTSKKTNWHKQGKMMRLGNSQVFWAGPAVFRGCSACSCGDPMTTKEIVNPKS